jgi:hypothetical protein
MKPCKDGISYMFIADVIQGRTTIGTSNKIIDISKHDSYVNNIYNPSILVSPYSDGAFPKYIIAFIKKQNNILIYIIFINL